MASLKSEIAQKPPFASAEEEALPQPCAHLRLPASRFPAQKTRGWGLTATQYNVLRILRGAEPKGLTCAAIGARMIAAEPDITRLLARLKRLQVDPAAPRPQGSARGLDRRSPPQD